MIIGRTFEKIAQDLLAEEEKRKEWHKIFVVWPRKLEDGRIAFLQHVERKSYFDAYLGRPTWVNRYREIK